MTKNIVSQSKKRHVILGEVVKVDGRTIGQIVGDTGYKDVSGKKHFIHYPKEAIAWTITALHAMQRAGAEFVETLDMDTGIRYRTTIQKYFDEGEKFNYSWGDQIKLTLPNFLQTVDPEYTSHTDTTAQEYTDPTDTHDEPKPLHYRSNAPKGVTFTKGVKQLDLWGRRR